MNQLEERILRLLIEKDNPYQAVPITFSDVELPYIIEAIKHLDNMGYVKQACTLCSASAILTSSGKYYIEEKEKREYGAYYDTIKELSDIISKAKDLSQSDNKKEISLFLRQSFIPYHDKLGEDAVYGFRTSFGTASSNEMDDFKADLNYLVKLLTRVLNEYKIEAQQARLEMARIEINPTFNNSNENHNSQNMSVEITLDQTMQEITKCQELSPEEKITLQQMLFEIETAKKGRNKSELWEKIRTAGKWILEKGIEVGVAALPYIAQALK